MLDALRPYDDKDPLSLSQHQNVFVDFHGWYETEHSVYLAMEYFDHGDLTQYIRQGLTERDAQVIGKQLLEGLAILHDQKWAHRDLKPQNIFVIRASPNWWVKIGDFGISKRLRDDEDGTSVGTYGYMAPEADSRLQILGDADTDSEAEGDEQRYKSSVAVDMWSLGCVLYQIPTKALPFYETRDLGKYCRNRLSFPQTVLLAHDVSQEGCTFIQRLMRARPQERLMAKAALQEPWIAAADDYDANPEVERSSFLETSPRPEQPGVAIDNEAAHDPPYASNSIEREPKPYATTPDRGKMYDDDLRPQSKLPNGSGALQWSNTVATADDTVKALEVPAHPSLDDAVVGVETLRLGRQPNIERLEQAERRKSASNGGTQRRSRSSSAESFYLVPNHGRSDPTNSSGRTKKSSSSTTVSNAGRYHNPRLSNQAQNLPSTSRRTDDSSPPSTVSNMSREHNPRLGIALWNFVKLTPTDLGLKQFEIVYNIRKKNGDWWYGTNESGEAGVFPSNYIGQTRLQAEALFLYRGEDSKDINLLKGERITNITISTPGWWIGTNSSGERGYFPGNYVKLDLDTIKEELHLERSLSNGRARHATSPPGPNPRRDSTSRDGSIPNGHAHYVVGRALKDYKASNGTIAFEH